jgi:hypothetical protein
MFLDAHDFLLERRGHGFRDDLRVGAGVGGMHPPRRAAPPRGYSLTGRLNSEMAPAMRMKADSTDANTAGR